MERANLAVDRYVMEAVVGLTTGDQTLTIDKGLLEPEPEARATPELLELQIRVRLNDFLQPEAAQQATSTVPGWARQMFPSIAEQARQDFGAEVERLAEQHLASHRWLMLRTWVQLLAGGRCRAAGGGHGSRDLRQHP